MSSPSSINLFARSILSGSLMAVAWPAIGGIAPLALLAWVPLFSVQHHLLTRGARPHVFFLHALFSMLVWNFATTYWLFLVSEPMSTRMFSLLGPNIANALLMTIPWVLTYRANKRLGALRGAFALVFYWLTFEYLHMNWDLTWPWLTLGNVFSQQTFLIQWYSVIGALGGSLWVLLSNLSIWYAWRTVRTSDRSSRLRVITFPLLVIIVPMFISSVLYFSYQPKGGNAEVVMVQPNVDPYLEKFGGMDPMAQLERMLAMANKAITPNTDLVIFPETALQESATCGISNGEVQLHGLWENELERSRSVIRLKEFLQSTGVEGVLAGMSSAYLFNPDEPLPASARPLTGTDRYYESYNAALFLRKDGELSMYNKSKLVPGVELLPFEGTIGSLKFLSVDLGGTTGSLGTQEFRTVFEVTPELRAAPVICYESVFGDFMTGYFLNGANLITVITNDGWWADSPAFHQHLAYARLRAVEFRRDVLRCANTGISCHIDQLGNVTEQTEWWEPATMTVQVELNDDNTFYAQHGDWIGRAAVFLAAIMILYSTVRGIAFRRS